MSQQASVITDELKKLVGVEAAPAVWEVEKGAIKKFAESIGDTNPLWQDERYARKSRYGGIVTPPTFLASLTNDAVRDAIFQLDLPVKRVLNGGNELEFFQPIRPGDVITVTGKLADVREREGRMGRMLFMVFEYTYTNQFGEVAAVGRNTIIRY